MKSFTNIQFGTVVTVDDETAKELEANSMYAPVEAESKKAPKTAKKAAPKTKK